MGVCFSVERWDLQQTPAATVSGRAETPTAVPGDDGAADPAVVAPEEEAGGDGQATRGREEAGSADCYGPVSGQLIAAMKEACRHAFQAKPQRLMAAMYTCEIMATAEVLGERAQASHYDTENHIWSSRRCFYPKRHTNCFG